ncbi:NAD-dependent protein deacetylase [Advenella mimigardefordensis]|uniref:NAD-dependent protein deacetylase n=1 Tax=Advenella mimigardefordensis (strain DSM 17166 / LMG 22922 / DPN7) TaxID=1247726 RepID=W0P9K9_ADVMD|nr:NAD-dependent protein deacetylase [Advenella mimigardefordensis]AHG63544.1 NAD-dependent deacetylase [Advenella mimigardefordensis DPN7]
MTAPDIDALQAFVQQHAGLLVITGAGCSTDSGIPAYRDTEGAWMRPPPMTFQQFMGTEAARQRYWARSMVGWSMFSKGRPNAAHQALQALELKGYTGLLVTQNVDGLHRQAGQSRLLELHGSLANVVCMQCDTRVNRVHYQQQLLSANPAWADMTAVMAPDGDVDLETDFTSFRIPPCDRCGGILKPDVVFFGETVPRTRVDAVYQALAQASAVLVVGSSLMVYSGYRFVRDAALQGKPVAAITRGRTRADAVLALKLDTACAPVLTALDAILAPLPQAGDAYGDRLAAV